MSVLRVNHTAFHVSNLDQSIDFYRTAFGYRVLWRRENGEEYVRTIVGYPTAILHQAMLEMPGIDHHLELIEYRNVPRKHIHMATANPGTAHICFDVADFDELYDHLLACGARAVSEPVAVPSGANAGRRAVYLLDPDDFRIELIDAERVGSNAVDTNPQT